MSDLTQHIAENIKRLRLLKQMKQKEVAALVGIPQGQYSRIENAKIEPTLRTLEKIALVLEVSLPELLRRQASADEATLLPLWDKIRLVEQLYPFFDNTVQSV